MNRILLPAFVFLAIAGCGILEEDITDRKVGIVAPADGARVAAGAVRFVWRCVDGAAGYGFTVVSPSFDGAGRVAADTVILADTMSRVAGCVVPLGEGDYEWSVTPFNSAYTGEPLTATLHVTSVRE